MKRLLLTVGLPRSGKSTWSNGSSYPVVCPDEIRRAMGVFPFVREMEPMVWFIVKVMVKALFASGASTVILDATNVTARRRAEWHSKEWEVTYVIFDTDADTCKRRCDTTNGYLVEVIHRMAKDADFTDWQKRGRIWGEEDVPCLDGLSLSGELTKFGKDIAS